MASLIAQLVKNHLQCWRPWFDSWVWKIPWRRDRLPIPVFLSFPCGSAGKESAWNVGDLGLIPGLGRSPGEGKGYPFQYSGLENPMDCIVHSVANNWTQLSNFHFLSHVFLWLAHQFPSADKQYNICHIWSLHQRKGAAPVTGVSTDRRCLGSTVSLLHRSRQLSLQVQWLWWAGTDVWLSYSVKVSLWSSFLPIFEWMSIRCWGPFPDSCLYQGK